MNHRIEKLDSRLKQKAFWLAMRHPDMEQDDFYQEMVLALLLKSNSDSTFIEQNDAYLMIFAHWTAIRLGETGQRYRKYVYREFQVLPKSELGFVNTDTWEFEQIFSPDKGRVVEDEIIRQEDNEHILEIYEELNPKEQHLVASLFLGYEQKDVAAEWGVSGAAVSQLKKAMSVKFL